MRYGFLFSCWGEGLDVCCARDFDVDLLAAAGMPDIKEQLLKGASNCAAGVTASGFQIDRVEVVYWGTCPECLANSSETKD